MLTTEHAAGLVPAAYLINRRSIVKIKILRSTVCAGKRVEKGKVMDADEKDAIFLISLGKAESLEKVKDEKKQQA